MTKNLASASPAHKGKRDPHPALAAWRKRLAAGLLGEHPSRPSTWVLDDLWHAASWEAAALDYEAAGLTDAAADCRRRAREVRP